MVGTVKALSADQVARAIKSDIANGRFDIFVNLGSRAATRTHCIIPSIAHWFCDSA
ncbi:MAG: hypothetical protein JNJ46_07560 [Myxococcales bacterium]|nr:hypothetical protein [Myxococcales bacterium]